MDKISILQNYINECKNIVFFDGAGVSTESGIKDFRSKDGLYNMNYKYPPEKILSHNFFMNNTNEFYKFYKDKLNCLSASPNVYHKYLKKLEENKNISIVTQNIDGLHEKVGSKDIYNLHGTIYNNHCMKCNKEYSAKVVFESNDIPKCTCGGIIKPDVVLYEEELNIDTINGAINAIENSELLVIVGTSLTVYPASGFVRFFKGKYIVIINNDSTQYDDYADLVINDNIGNIFNKLK